MFTMALHMSIVPNNMAWYCVTIQIKLSLNKCNSSELSNAAAISPFRNITWPTSFSRHDNTLKCGKIHCYNDICEIAKTPIC